MARTIGLTEEELYAPAVWEDCSEGYEDILFQKSEDGIAASSLTVRRCVMHSAPRPLKK